MRLSLGGTWIADYNEGNYWGTIYIYGNNVGNNGEQICNNGNILGTY